MRSWSRLRILASATVVAATMLATAGAAELPSTTLEFIPQADLRVLDPVWTTATITRNHGYMVYDTLFARDREPVDKGGWSVIHTNFPGEDMIDPAINIPLRGNGSGAWFGWPSDERIETLRDQWLEAADPAEQKRIAAEIQKEAFESVPYIPVGEFFFYTAFRKDLEGVNLAPALFMWNVEKMAAVPGGRR